MRILDLGCGMTKKKGAIGIDRVPVIGVDVIAKLTEFPYPLADNTFDIVYLNNVIEHLPDTIAIMEEIYRITRPSARIYISVVNWNSIYTAMDPTHVTAFTESSFDFFGSRPGRNYYTHARFEVVRVDYQYNALACAFLRSHRLMKFLSYYLCNILEGLNFELRTAKDADTLQVEGLDERLDIFTVLRCPQCLSVKTRKPNGDPGRLKLFRSSWLICQDGCGGKYPVYDGLPVMLRKEAELRVNIPPEDLPVPPPDEIKRVPIESPSANTGFSRVSGLEKMNQEWASLGRYFILIIFLIIFGLGYFIVQIGFRFW